MDRSFHNKTVDQIIRDARERINAVFAAIEGEPLEESGGDSAQSGQHFCGTREPARPPSPNFMFAEEREDLMRFSLEEPQQSNNTGQIVRGLPTGRRPTREEERRIEQLREQRYRQLVAQGRIPPERQLPEVPQQVPDWALAAPSSPAPPPPQWPHDFYLEPGHLRAPWQDPREILEDFDPHYLEPESRPPSVSYEEMLAPTWDSPARPRRPQMPPLPQEALEQLDPYYTPPSSVRPTPSYIAELSPLGTPTTPARTSRSPSPERGAESSEYQESRQQRLPEAASPITPRPQSTRLSHRVRARVPVPPRPPLSPVQEEEFVAEVSNIISETRERLNNVMRKMYGHDLDSVLRRK